MNLLYITDLTGWLFAGPNYSVPAQITAQSKYDNVFWININDNDIAFDKEGLKHKISDIKGKIPDDLPKPFNKPDLVIFEEFYRFPFNKIIYRVIKNKIPYVIVPRSQMTYQARQYKKIKKFIGGILFFNWFAKKAKAIHYLTDAEKADSAKYKKESFVIPNGINMPTGDGAKNTTNQLNITFIGRLNIFQKGIDVLFDACEIIKDDLIKNNVKLCFYGPDQGGSFVKMQEWCISKNLEKIIEIKSPVFGEEKAEVLKNSNFFILTSRFEGMPMGVLDALSYGVPCIVTPGTNMLDKIVVANAGFGCEFSVQSIAQVIKKAVLNCDDLQVMGKNAKQLAMQYSWDEIAKKTHEIYKSLV